MERQKDDLPRSAFGHPLPGWGNEEGSTAEPMVLHSSIQDSLPRASDDLSESVGLQPRCWGSRDDGSGGGGRTGPQRHRLRPALPCRALCIPLGALRSPSGVPEGAGSLAHGHKPGVPSGHKTLLLPPGSPSQPWSYRAWHFAFAPSRAQFRRCQVCFYSLLKTTVLTPVSGSCL